MRILHCLGAAALLASASAAQAEAALYKVDPLHTYATFAIDHFGASVNRGRVDGASGTVHFDKQAKTGRVDVQLSVDTLQSGSKDFNDHLKSADIFNAAQFATMRFVSDKLVFEGDKLVEVPGQLTLLGKTMPVTLKARQFNCYPNPMAKTEACGGDFEATIDRSQWGVSYGLNFGVPAQVKITATIEAFKQ